MNEYPVYAGGYQNKVGTVILTEEAEKMILSLLPDLVDFSIEYSIEGPDGKPTKLKGFQIFSKPVLSGEPMAVVKMEQPIYNFAAVTKEQLKAVIREVLEE